jgi:hypothetical protein
MPNLASHPEENNDRSRVSENKSLWKIYGSKIEQQQHEAVKKLRAL